MEKDQFVERMLETENLTDELEDSDANWLLNWGIAHLDKVIMGITDADAAGDRVNALMAVMRKINRITGTYATSDPQSLTEELAILGDLYEQAFGKATGDLLCAALVGESGVSRLVNLSTRQALELLAQAPTMPE